jgi:hypothetical protein
MTTALAAKTDLDDFNAVWSKYRAQGREWVPLLEAMAETDRLLRFYEVRVALPLGLRCTEAMCRDQKIAAYLVVEFLQDVIDQILECA